MSDSSTTTVQTIKQTWYVEPDEQLELLKGLNQRRGWGFSEKEFPRVPAFAPTTPSEVLMLAIGFPAIPGTTGPSRTFNELWPCVTVMGRLGKTRWPGVGREAVIDAIGAGHEPGLRWVGFDPISYVGLSPREAELEAGRDERELAGSEVLVAAILWPQWVARMSGNVPQAFMSRLRRRNGGVPYIANVGSGIAGHKRRYTKAGSAVRLSVYRADNALSSWASPTVRAI